MLEIILRVNMGKLHVQVQYQMDCNRQWTPLPWFDWRKENWKKNESEIFNFHLQMWNLEIRVKLNWHKAILLGENVVYKDFASIESQCINRKVPAGRLSVGMVLLL